MRQVEKIFKPISPVNHCTNDKNKKHKIYLTGKMFCSISIFTLLEHIKYIVENKTDTFCY